MGKIRQSNMELLRMIAMFMILIIHANMISLPKPTHAELVNSPLPTGTRYLIESFGIVGVDIFVMLSGWFLINSRLKSFLSLSFQVITLWGGCFFVFYLLGETQLSAKNLLEIFAFTRWDWFIKAYIVLMIIAPILNSFVKNSSEKTQRSVLIGFFMFSSTYGWLGGANRFFVNGYGPLLFIGIYLLSQYVHNTIKDPDTPYKIRHLFSLDKKWDILIFGICISVNTMMGLLGLFFNIGTYGKVYAYTNPINIIAALYLLLFFSKLTIKPNKCINVLAAGAFAVYLLHSQVDIRPLFTEVVQSLYYAHEGILCVLYIFLFLILVYLASVVADLPRLKMWNLLSNKFNIK